MARISFGVEGSQAFLDLFGRLDAVLPEGGKIADFFTAVNQDIKDLVQAGEFVGIDLEDLLGHNLKITARIEPSSDLEAAYLMLRRAREMAEQKKEEVKQ